MPKPEEEISKSPGAEEKTPPIDERGGEGKNYIIAIGIDKYKSGKNLPTCKNDCKELTGILTKRYGFEIFDQPLFDDKATKGEVKTLFKKFGQSEISGNDSLIIYFSGHGYMYPIRDENDEIAEYIGCWVPHEGMPDDLETLFKVQDIIDEVRLLRKLRHILIISDCCNSGALLETNGFYSRNGQVPPKLKSIEIARSRWAICSGRSNEPSAAGRQGGLSRYTEVLVKILDENPEERLLISSLIGALNTAFDEKFWQKPWSGPLDLIPNNGGEFVFKIKRNDAQIKKREQILFKDIINLNYKLQFESFKSFGKKGKTEFAIFSGRPTCGLPLLSYYARSELNIPNYFPVSYNKFWDKEDLFLVRGLRDALKLDYPLNASTLDKISDNILTRLESAPVTLEIRFYNELDPSEGTVTVPRKQELLEKLASYAETINGKIKGDHCLHIFVVDFDFLDYTPFSKDDKIGNIHSIIVPFTEAITLKVLTDWYDAMKRTNTFFGAQLTKQQFDELFSFLPALFDQMLQQTNGFPGSTLISICQAAQCDKLIEKIMDPDKN